MQLDWRPFFLRPDTPPEGMPVPDYVRARRSDPRNPLKRRAEALGLKMVERDVVPSTRRAHEAAELARAHGKLAPLHAALLRRYWSEGQDLHQMDVLRAAAQESGLDPEELQADLEAGTYREAVERSVREAHALGIDAVPTFVFEERFAVQGAQEYPIFELAMDRLGAKPRG